MQPAAPNYQKDSENSRQHTGILPCFDVAEDASDEAADSAKESDGKEDDASEDKDICYWSVGEMVHAAPPGIGGRSLATASLGCKSP